MPAVFLKADSSKGNWGLYFVSIYMVRVLK